METGNTKTAVRQTDISSAANLDDDAELVGKRLAKLVAINRETDREKSLSSSDRERFDAVSMKNPLSSEKAFAYLGLFLGTFPPAAIFAKIFLGGGDFYTDFWLIGIFAVVSLIAAIVGYFSGKLVGKIVRDLEKLSWLSMLLMMPLIGLLWGILSGGAGGIIIFIVGAIFGAGLGAPVGAAALPAVVIFHRLLKKGDLIERAQFLPIALGITFIICGYILGL